MPRGHPFRDTTNRRVLELRRISTNKTCKFMPELIKMHQIFNNHVCDQITAACSSNQEEEEHRRNVVEIAQQSEQKIAQTDQ